MTDPQTAPAAQLPEPDHQCQNACGRRAQHVLVNLDDSSADILCGICIVAMFAAVIDGLAAPDGETAGTLAT
jgi:hypothetical protein